MAIIKPFKALRPQPQLAKQVASLPYDVLNTAEAKSAAEGNHSSFLHITKSEIDLPESVDIHDPAVYAQAKENLSAFISRDILFRETKACYYIYQLIMQGRSQTGIVCVSSIDDYDQNKIKKHEFTRPEKELDRINHITISGAQTGNVFLAYRDLQDINVIVDKWKESKSPVYDFNAEDGIQHTIWIINDDKVIADITSLFEKEIPYTYIADGHHRAASAAKVRQTLGDAATEAADYFLTTLFPANQLYIMDYNRVVKDLNGLTVPDFLKALEKAFKIELIGNQAYRPEALHTFGLFINKQWYKLSALPGVIANDPIGILDISILQAKVLDPLLGIKDQRTDKRIDFVGGIRGLGELERRVNSGEMAAAFSLFPVSIHQLFDIADSGNVMPPKSTWFEPKLRDGLLTHLIYE